MTDPSRTTPAASDPASADSQGPLDPTLSRPKDEPNFAAPAHAGEVGQLGRYRVLQKLGAGGMGAVYLGYDAALERKVALKVMLPQHATNRDAKERFLREAKAAAKVHSDHVVIIHDVGEERGIPFIAMEYLLGSPLDKFLKTKGNLALQQSLRVVRETALGLAAAHALGLIHRDIKPGNIWLEAPKGRVKILDFGLARPAEDDAHLTGSGAVLGTPAYMSPEQGRGLKVDHRTDLFSLGVLLYRLTTGKMPFTGDGAMAVLTSLAVDTPIAPRQHNPELPESVEAVIHRLLAKNPAERFQTAKEVIDALTEVENPRSNSGQLPVVVATPVPPLAVGAQTQNVWEGIDASESVPVPLADGTDAEPASAAARASAPRGPRSERKKGGKGMLLAAGVAVLLAAGVGGVVVLQMGGKKEPEAKAPEGGLSGDTAGTKVGPLLPGYTNGIGMEFVRVPKGTGWLGGGGGNLGGTKVVIEQDFYLGKYEVTQEEWEAITGLTPSHFSRLGGGKDAVKDIGDAELKRFPVEGVSWDDCQLFIESLNKREKESGWVYRLPTESEWEYACRGGPVDKLDSAFDFYFAKPTNTLLSERANFNSVLKRTCRVGSYEPNSLGLYDMHGNAWEWCEDADKRGDGASFRVSRGGSCGNAAGDCRAAFRTPRPSSSRGVALGLRLARVPFAQAGNSAVGTDPDRTAAEWVLALGGSVGVNDDQPGITAPANLPKEPFRLTFVKLADTNLPDAGLANFKDCKSLTHLELRSVTVSDAAWANFKGCKDLTYLTLRRRRLPRRTHDWLDRSIIPRVVAFATAHERSYFFPSARSITQQPRTWTPSERQWFRMPSLSQPAS